MRLTKREIKFLIDFWKDQEPSSYMWDVVGDTVTGKWLNGYGKLKRRETRIAIVKRHVAEFRRTVEFKLMCKLGIIRKDFADDMESDFIARAKDENAK
jgi:hypothetical protein